MSVTARLLPAALALGLALPAAAQDTLTPETVVATVNGTEITLGHMVALRSRLPQQYQQLPAEVLFPGILDQLVQQQLLADTEEALSPGGQVTIDNEERAILANQAIGAIAANAATDEALAAAYEEQFASAEPDTEYNASHILVETEEEAAAIVEELQGGADFATLAQERSTGPSGPNGGLLGWFGAGAMVEPFETAVMALEAGAISEPVQTQFGWHVILLNETRLAEAPPLEAVRGELTEQLQRAAVDDRIAELTEAGDVDRSAGDALDPAVLNDPALIPQ
ncbi:MAG: peptidylprolyl isomerase [Paracoccaceae bacterium]|nr:peptidylprolyl isomerase [Paracoccaceae bacterium]